MTPTQHQSANERRLLRALARQLRFTACVNMPHFSKHDATCEDERGRTWILESKTRKFPHDSFDSALVERDKWWHLMDRLAQNECDHAAYVEFYSDGRVRLWLVERIEEPVWSQRSLVTTTMDRNNAAKMKWCAELPYSAAHILTTIDRENEQTH